MRYRETQRKMERKRARLAIFCMCQYEVWMCGDVCAYMCVLYHGRLVFLKEKKEREQRKTRMCVPPLCPMEMTVAFCLFISAPHSLLTAWGDSMVHNWLFIQGKIAFLFTHLLILAEIIAETSLPRASWSSGLMLVMSCGVFYGAYSSFLVNEPHLVTHTSDDLSSSVHLPCYSSNQMLPRQFWGRMIPVLL